MSEHSETATQNSATVQNTQEEGASEDEHQDYIQAIQHKLNSSSSKDTEHKLSYLSNLLDLFEARRQAYQYLTERNYSFDIQTMTEMLLYLLKTPNLTLPAFFSSDTGVSCGGIRSPFYFHDVIFDFNMSNPDSFVSVAPKTAASKAAAAAAAAASLAGPCTGRSTIYIRKRDKKKSKLDERENFKFINLDEWFYNPMQQTSQPKFRVLSPTMKEAMLKKYNIEKNQIPKMDCTSKEDGKKDGERDVKGDVVGRYLGFNSGDIVEIHRRTKMNGIQIYYRKVN
jgi:DNA-directed RNA polymerase subunit H (RpoH/RPB5)